METPKLLERTPLLTHTCVAVLAAQSVAKMEWFDVKKFVPEVFERVLSVNDGVFTRIPSAPTQETNAAPGGAAAEGGDGEDQAQEKETEEEETYIAIPELKEFPGMRHSHGMAAVDGVLYCFGGITKIDGKEWPSNNVSFQFISVLSIVI